MTAVPIGRPGRSGQRAGARWRRSRMGGKSRRTQMEIENKAKDYRQAVGGPGRSGLKLSTTTRVYSSCFISLGRMDGWAVVVAGFSIDGVSRCPVIAVLSRSVGVLRVFPVLDRRENSRGNGKSVFPFGGRGPIPGERQSVSGSRFYRAGLFCWIFREFFRIYQKIR